MPRREMLALVAGLVIGLFIGMILIGSSDSLRESLFGTAGEKDEKKDVEYYLVSLDDVETWLEEVYPDEGDKFKSSVSLLSELPTNWETEEEFKAAEEEFKVLLPHTYGALVDEKDIENLKADPNGELSACLGMDDDPYGATMYLYLTIPEDTGAKIDIPKEWETLKRPKTNEVYWKLVACYPALEE